MLDQWQHDVLKAISSRNVDSKGDFTQSDCVLANIVLFDLVKSYVFGKMFEGASLHIRNDKSGYSWVHLPDYDDPDTKNTIRSECHLNCLRSKYHAEDYDYDSPDLQWKTDRNASSSIYVEPVNFSGKNEVLNILKEKPYYAMLLEEDPTKQEKYLSELSDVKINIYEELEYLDLLKSTNMYRFTGNPVTEVFGHRYASHSNERIMMIASNALGPVGIMALASYAKKQDSQRNADRLSLSYVSISPEFRQRGISKKMLQACFKYAIENKKFITRTAPSQMGQRVSFDSYSDFAQKYFPKVPFVKDDYVCIINPIYNKFKDFKNYSYQDKCFVINECLTIAQRHLQERLKDHPYTSVDCLDQERIMNELESTISIISKRVRKPSLEMLNR